MAMDLVITRMVTYVQLIGEGAFNNLGVLIRDTLSLIELFNTSIVQRALRKRLPQYSVFGCFSTPLIGESVVVNCGPYLVRYLLVREGNPL